MPEKKHATRPLKNTVKAKSFTFVLEQIGRACDEIALLHGDVPMLKYAEIWTCFIPQISNSPVRCSRFKTSKEPREIVVSMLGSDCPDTGDVSYKMMAALLTRIVCDTNSPLFEPLASEAIVSQYFDSQAIDTFIGLLHQDFGSAPAHLYNEFEDSLNDLMMRIAFLNNHQRLGAIGARLSSIVLLLLASLYGPRDYRPDMHVDVYSKREQTRLVQRARADVATPKDLGIEQTAYLTRVTFGQNPPDERDWIVCQTTSGETNEVANRFMSYSLEGKTEVFIARGIERFDEKGPVLRIPVDCDLASSQGHLRMTLEDGSWTLVDLDSTNGTLVVRRNGDKFCLYKHAEIPDESVVLQNGDVICIAPKWDITHADPSCPAFVFHTATIDWG